MKPVIGRGSSPVRGLGIERRRCSDRYRVRTDSRSIRYSYVRFLLERLHLWSAKRRGRRHAERSMAQDTADIVPLQHLEAIANHARLQDGIRVGIDRVLDRQALQGSQL